MRTLLVLLVCAALAGCSFLSREQPEPTLADLQPARLPAANSELPSVTLAELEGIYREVLEVAPDHQVRLQVLHRLADIEMLQAEEQLAESDSGAELLREAIVSYRGLLAEDPDAPDNDRLLYQLSKAYDLLGEPDRSLVVLEQLSARYPGSPHYVEAQFRIAESYFSAGRYRAAEQAYSNVIEQGAAGSHYRNSLYMRGWSQFKQGRYRPSIGAFTATLDLLLPQDNALDALSPAERELVLDSFRVLAVVFSYLEGADTIAAAYEQLGYRHYVPLLYRELGELYIKQERVRDSAETYRAFIVAWPDSRYAHEFQISVIEIYEKSGFPDLILQEKRNYVEAYAVTGDYWQRSSPQVRAQIDSNLQLYINELATHYHALAQAYAGIAADADEASAIEPDAEQAAHYYQLAGDHYQLYIDSFPQDARVPDMGFLLAESRLEAGLHREALAAYQWVAYDYPQSAHAADAGYAAILVFDTLGDAAEAAEREQLAREKIDSQLRYASVFAGDPRAPLVLNDAAAALMQRGEYQLAIIAAATLRHWQPPPGLEILVPATLVIAHSYFELEDFAEAERDYDRALALMPAGDERIGPATDRLAASVYRQAEQLAAAGDAGAAARRFARVMEIAPESGIRVQAQFDAANNFMAAGDYSRANALLVDFRQRFPEDPLAAGVALKLVNNYEQLQQWELAARELDGLLPAEQDPERQRKLLFLTAEYYDQAGNSEFAILRYRSYAHGWPEPLGVRMEAMNRLSELYDATGEPSKRRFWLRKMIAAHENAGESRSDRSLYLAAYSSSVFADDAYQAYRAIAIAHPVKKSLKRKKTAMEKVLADYQRTNAYGVAEFATLATYRMGEVYRGLSEDLLDSERPADLDALALEQYELLLEEQAYPFEEKAIAIHESNARRSWDGIYDQWVKSSFDVLGSLMPARYAKTELAIPYSTEIF